MIYGLILFFRGALLTSTSTATLNFCSWSKQWKKGNEKWSDNLRLSASGIWLQWSYIDFNYFFFFFWKTFLFWRLNLHCFLSILWFIGFLHLPQVLTENRCTSAERPFSKELFFVAFVGHKKGHEEWSSRFSCTARSLLWACFLNIFKKPSSRQNSLILRLERSYFLFALACSYTRTFLYCQC